MPVVVVVGAGNVQICKAVRSDGQIPPGEGAVGPDQQNNKLTYPLGMNQAEPTREDVLSCNTEPAAIIPRRRSGTVRGFDRGLAGSF